MFSKEEQISTGFDALGTTTDDQRVEILWDIDEKAQDQNLLQEMNDPSLFYNDQFPQIPDFPCMSSSSSSSSNPAPVKPISSTTTSSGSSVSSSTSSAASWAVLKPDYVNDDVNGDGNGEDKLERTVTDTLTETLTAVDGSGTIDCMDVMENFGYIDLMDGNELWDPSSIFEQNPPEIGTESEVVNTSEVRDGRVDDEENDDDDGRLDELGVMFFEWLKSNKEVISAEDMRNIKLKKSTVECASKRLGSSKEGKKQLLKLILEWVQQYQLQRKDNGGGGVSDFPSFLGLDTPPPPGLQAATSTPIAPPFSSWVPPNEISNGFTPPWMTPFPPYMADQTGNGICMVPAPVTYMSGDYNSGLNCGLNPNPYSNTNSGEYRVLESAPSWNPSQMTMVASPYGYGQQIMPALGPCYPDQYPYNPNVYAGGGDEPRLVRLGPSATKEARKKRMARQRRTYFHHHHHSRQSQSNHQNHVSNIDPHSHPMLADDSISAQSHGGNWLFWPSPEYPTTVPQPPVEVPHQPSSCPLQSGDCQSKQASSDKRQELKTEKNLKFLLQKVLKQSDVGSLGRIVLPKKEAESHLPDLESRDGVTIDMEDIGTSQVWNMRYRFWPNNKSRMYLLENTGDFVKANGLQEGDFIVIYSDIKCGKYLIRGVKVRQPATAKLEGKKPVKRSYRSISQSARSPAPSSPAKIAAT